MRRNSRQKIEKVYNTLITSEHWKRVPKKKLRNKDAYEKIISESPDHSFGYSTHIKKRFLLGEKAIYSYYAYDEYHRRHFKKERNLDFEKYVVDYISNAYPYKSHGEILGIDENVLSNCLWYCQNIIKGRWAELESAIVSVFDRFDYLLCWFVRDYSKEIIKGRWHNLENKLMKMFFEQPNYDNFLSEYVYDNVTTEWPEFEKAIEKIEISKINANKYNYFAVFEVALSYYSNSTKNRWKVLENWIKIDEHSDYAFDLNGHNYWDAVEKKIKQALAEQKPDILDFQDYERFTDIVLNFARKNPLTEEVKNYLIARSLVNDNKSKLIIKHIKSKNSFNDKVKLFLSKFDQNMTLKELTEAI